MQEHALDALLDRVVSVDVCEPCQSFWFDARESLQLTPGATLTLFQVIGERAGRPQWRYADVSRCPRCSARLRRTQDLQRTTRFEYFRCPHGHGRLISFLEFLKEKNFIKPLSPEQIAQLRQQLEVVNCSNCGAGIDLARGSTCVHCGSPLSMVDTAHAETMLAQLRDASLGRRRADAPERTAESAGAARPTVSPGGEPTNWYADVTALGLVSAGLHRLARWLRSESEVSGEEKP
jgi:hypothetical protein